MLRLGAILALLLAAPAAAQPMPGMLSINDGALVRVASAAEVQQALARCVRRGTCASIFLETCDRCILSAQAMQSGFAIRSRLGPPGPEYRLFDSRERRAPPGIFTSVETIEIFAGYISGRQPGYVRAVPADEESPE